MFLFTDSLAHVHSYHPTLVTEMYFVLFLPTRANRHIRVMHGGICISLTGFCEFVGEEISRPAGISYLLQAVTWEIFFHPTIPIKGNTYMTDRFFLSSSHHIFVLQI